MKVPSIHNGVLALRQSSKCTPDFTGCKVDLSTDSHGITEFEHVLDFSKVLGISIVDECYVQYVTGRNAHLIGGCSISGDCLLGSCLDQLGPLRADRGGQCCHRSCCNAGALRWCCLWLVLGRLGLVQSALALAPALQQQWHG